MRYTDKQKALIQNLIHSHFLSGNAEEPLRDSFAEIYAHLRTDTLSAADLRQIESALAFFTPCARPVCLRESPGDMVDALSATRLMLRRHTFS